MRTKDVEDDIRYALLAIANLVGRLSKGRPSMVIPIKLLRPWVCKIKRSCLNTLREDLPGPVHEAIRLCDNVELLHNVTLSATDYDLIDAKNRTSQ